MEFGLYINGRLILTKAQQKNLGALFDAISKEDPENLDYLEFNNLWEIAVDGDGEVCLQNGYVRAYPRFNDSLCPISYLIECQECRGWVRYGDHVIESESDECFCNEACLRKFAADRKMTKC